MTNSGEPGAASEFYIRGIGTFGGRTQPLILLDDVEISVGDLNRIPAETIKSFTILKDASATAIYGVRGANGVMLVTTKTGRANTRTEVNVTVENSFVQPVNKVNFVDGGTWMELYNEATLARGGVSEVYSKSQIDLTRSHDYPYLFPDVNWDDLLFRDFNMNQRANINISGGGNRATYYMSLNMNHNTGIVNAPRDYIFNNNIHSYITDKEVRAERTIHLRHGEKMLFGKEMNRGLVLDGHLLKAVTVGQDGYTMDDVLVHDATTQNFVMHQMLAMMDGHELPLAIGVIRNVEAPTYDGEVTRQVEEVRQKKNYPTLRDIILSGDTWEVK